MFIFYLYHNPLTQCKLFIILLHAIPGYPDNPLYIRHVTHRTRQDWLWPARNPHATGTKTRNKTIYANLDAGTKVTDKESSDLATLRNMMTYIEEHFANHISLEEIALAGACCKSKCSLLFKKYLRDTPSHTLQSCGLEKASALCWNLTQASRKSHMSTVLATLAIIAKLFKNIMAFHL